MALGGKREGAGRKVGSKNLGKKLRDYITNDEIEELIKLAKEQAKTQPIILKFVLEQIFGKAIQPIGNETDDDGKSQPLLVKFIGDENSRDTTRIQETI